MKQQNKPASNIISFDLFKFFLLDEDKVYLSVDISPDLIYTLIEMLGNEYKFIYCSENPVCPVCGAKLNKNDLTEFKLNKNLIIYKQKYSCSSKKCNPYEIADTTKYIPKYGNYTFKSRIRMENCFSKSDKNEELLPQTLLGTVRVSFKTYSSCRPLS